MRASVCKVLIESPERRRSLRRPTCRWEDNIKLNGSTVFIAIGYRLDDRGAGIQVKGVKVKNFHFSVSSRLAVGPTQPPIKWVPGALSSGGKVAEV
jgi:hypothetical protein